MTASALWPVVGPASAASAAGPLIQPGERVSSGAGSCTLNFVFDGAGAQTGNVYVGTAAHCVGTLGERMSLSDGTSFGTVAVMGDENQTADDYAFIQVDAALTARVRASVKGHPTFPRGVTSAAETGTGDVVVQSGYGLGFDVTAQTREGRKALLSYDNSAEAGVIGATVWGDSGGPLVHERSGKALGLVSRLCVGRVCEERGPTIEGVLSRAAARGFHVSLRRA